MEHDVEIEDHGEDIPSCNGEEDDIPLCHPEKDSEREDTEIDFIQ